MNEYIHRTLKNNLLNTSTDKQKSTTELCIIELLSGNYLKVTELSEEIIKNDINNSTGWALKAISQVNLFDYAENIFLLKSSISSLNEFKSKTTLTVKEVKEVEVVYITAYLQKTITLVKHRIAEVIELRQKALNEKSKARLATIGAVFSAYSATQAKSSLGKIVGYGGAIAGVSANLHFNTNAELLNNASKGVFGIAVANISLTFESALILKNNLDELDQEFQNESKVALRNWINTVSILYQQVIENLITYAREIKKKDVLEKPFRVSAINLISSPEVQQFIYLSKLLQIENTIPQFNELEKQIFDLGLIEEKEVIKSINKMKFFIIIFAFVPYLYFQWSPLGPAGKLKYFINEFLNSMKSYKIDSNNIILNKILK